MTNDELIISTAIADGIPDTLAILMAAQARHETGNYTHRFFTTGKNAFGYSYVKGAKWQLPTPGPTADNGAAIAQYATVQNSVHELTDWIKRRQREGRFPGDLSTITNETQYATLLKKAGYFGAPLQIYIDGIARALRLMGQVVISPAGGSLILLAILVVAFRKKIFG